jgi:hypothetical protein
MLYNRIRDLSKGAAERVTKATGLDVLESGRFKYEVTKGTLGSAVKISR